MPEGRDHRTRRRGVENGRGHPEAHDTEKASYRRRLTVVWFPSGHVFFCDHLVPDPPSGITPATALALGRAQATSGYSDHVIAAVVREHAEKEKT